MADATFSESVQDSVLSLYMAFFGRAPDADGFNYWCQQLSPPTNASPFKIAADFALDPTWQATYGDKSPVEQVDLFYQNTLGRTADAEGLAYWVAEIENGSAFSTVAFQIVWAAKLGGQNVDPSDYALVNNKIDVAEYFVTVLVSNDVVIAQTAFNGVTQDPATVVVSEILLTKEVETGIIVATVEQALALPIGYPYALVDTSSNLAIAPIGILNAAVSATIVGGGTVTAAVLTYLADAVEGQVNALTVTEVTGSAVEVQSTFDVTNLTLSGKVNLTISDTGAIAATVMTDLAGATTGEITSSGVTSITGTAAATEAALDDSQLVSLAAVNVTISDAGAIIAATVLTDLAGATTGEITSSGVTSVTGTAAQAQAALDDVQLVSLAAVDVTISDTGTIDATVLTDLVGATTGMITSAAVTGVTGTATQAKTALDDAQLVSLAAVNVAISDTGAIAATVLTDLAGATTGEITSAAITSITGTAAATQAALDDAQLVSLAAVNVTISDAGAITATVLTDLVGATTGEITSSGVTSITGTAIQAQAALDNVQLVSLDAVDVTISDTGAIAAAVLTDLADATTGEIISSGVTSITGTAIQAQAALDNVQLVSLVVVDVTISDTGAIAAAVLTDLADATTGEITSSGVTSITGTAAATQAALNDAQLVSLGAVNVTISDTGTIAATVLTDLAGATTGTITSTAITSIAGTAAATQAALNDAQLVSLRAVNVTISDAGVIAATVLTDLVGATTGTITSTAITSIVGTAAATQAALDNVQLVSLGAVDVTLSGTTTVTATELLGISSGTTGAVNATTIAMLTGALGSVSDVRSDVDIRLSADFELNVTGTADSDDINFSAWTTGAMIINGLDGNDTITGGVSADSIEGGLGNDIITGATGSNTITGGLGADIFSVAGGSTDSITDLGVGEDSLIVGEDGAVIAKVTEGWTATGTTNNSGSVTLTINEGVDIDLSRVNRSKGFTITASGNTEASDIVGSALADIITGGTGNDTLSGGSGNDSITGGLGQDMLMGGVGLNTLTGGAGADTFSVSGGSTDNITDLGVGEDALIVGEEGTVIADVTENWIATGGTSNSGVVSLTLSEGVNVDLSRSGSYMGYTITAAGNTEASEIISSALVDTITGGAGNDTITGNAGADMIDAGAGTNIVNAGNGRDVITVSAVSTNTINLNFVGDSNLTTVIARAGTGERSTTITAGTLNNEIDLKATAAGSEAGVMMTAALATGTTRVVFTGGNGADSIVGSLGDDTLNGGSGNDTIMGSAGSDLLIGGDGADTVSYSDVTSSTPYGLLNIAGIAINLSTVIVTAEQIALSMGGGVVLGGGSGVVGEDLAAGTNGYLVNSASDSNPFMVRDTLVGFEGVIGSALNDYIVLGSGHDTIQGESGNDYLKGNDGNDLIDGGEGNDIINSGQGNDTVWGGEGGDQIYGGTTGEDMLCGEGGDDIFLYAAEYELENDAVLMDAAISGGEGTDRISVDGRLTVANTVSFAKASSIEELYVTGTAQSNIALDVSAQTAGIATINISTSRTNGNVVDVSEYTTLAATVVGSTANSNILTGGAAADTMTGGSDTDTITGGAGADVITGGAGVNTFVYNAVSGVSSDSNVTGSRDQITDLKNSDFIQLNLNGPTVGSLQFDVMTDVSGGNNFYAANTDNDMFNAGVSDVYIDTNLILNHAQARDMTVLNAIGTDRDDVISGGSAADTITGGDGHDILSGNDGADTIMGGDGNDTITGGDGSDTITGGDGADVLTGSSGVNTYFYNAAVGTSSDSNLFIKDRITDLKTSDFIYLNLSNVRDFAVAIDILATSTTYAADTDSNSGYSDIGDVIIAITGSVVDTAQAQSMTVINAVGTTGNDTISGGINNDTIIAGEGNDIITGGLGANVLSGGDGSDSFIYASSSSLRSFGQLSDVIDGGSGTNTLVIGNNQGTQSSFQISSSMSWSRMTNVSRIEAVGSFEAQYSIALSDDAYESGLRVVDLSDDTSISGNANIISVAAETGSANGYELVGSAFSDLVTGGAGNDSISGGNGNDNMTGGAGADVLTGGAGSDTFVYATGATGMTLATADTISDFTTGSDTIATGLTGANVSITDGSVYNIDSFSADAAEWFGSDGPEGEGVFVAYNAAISGNAWVAIDNNGDNTFSIGDSLIVLNGIDLVSEITYSNFTPFIV